METPDTRKMVENMGQTTNWGQLQSSIVIPDTLIWAPLNAPVNQISNGPESWLSVTIPQKVREFDNLNRGK